MKVKKAAWLLAALVIGLTAAEMASAHGGYYRHGGPRVHLGFVFGGPFWYGPPPYYYYPPAYYYPPVAVAPAAPTTYIERGDANVPQEQQAGYWYYCPEAKAYYPYVRQCAGGWQRVTPQPQN